MSQVGEILRQVRKRLKDQGRTRFSDMELIDALNRAMSDTWDYANKIRSPFIEEVYDFVLGEGESYLDLPAPALRINRFWCPKLGHYLEPKSPSGMPSYSCSGIPEFYCMIGGQIKVAPACANDVDMELDYVPVAPTVASVVDTLPHVFSPILDDVLVGWTVARAEAGREGGSESVPTTMQAAYMDKLSNYFGESVPELLEAKGPWVI